MKYTVFNSETGEPVRWGEVPDDLLGMQAQEPGEAVIEGVFPAGQFVWDGLQMVATGPALAQLQAAKWQAMKLARRAALTAPLVTPYGTFDADERAAANIVQTAQLMQTAAQSFAPDSAPSTDFTLADNSVVTLTAGEMVNVALLLAAQIQTAYARGRVVRAAIAAANTPEDLDAITWSTE